MKFSAVERRAITGAVINFNSSERAAAFNQGHNLHRLTLTQTAIIEVPIIPPTR
jgi:hypothetical protein